MTDRPKSKPTSFDVARHAGVHRSVVSRALAGTGRMSDETRQKVIDSAKELGYRVNFLARGLQNQSSGLVGIVASRLDTPYRASQVRFAARELIERGFTPILIVAEGDTGIGGLIERLLNYSVSGMIVTSDSPPVEIIEECARFEVPVVLVNRDTAVAGADRVQLSIEDSAALAHSMLCKTGGERFATLLPRDETYTVNGRAQAFVDCCNAAGQPVEVVRPKAQNYVDGLEAADLFVSKSCKADAVFATTDLLALGFLDGLRTRHGVEVPEQVQVLGYDDIEQAGWLNYQLSTIRQDSAETAIQAVEMIQSRLAEPGRAYQIAPIPITPVYRETTLDAQE